MDSALARNKNKIDATGSHSPISPSPPPSLPPSLPQIVRQSTAVHLPTWIAESGLLLSNLTPSSLPAFWAREGGKLGGREGGRVGGKDGTTGRRLWEHFVFFLKVSEGREGGSI